MTKQEDAELRRVVAANRRFGVSIAPAFRDIAPFTCRLRAFAHSHGRTYAAVRQRASRLGLRSSAPLRRK